jgi:uncharacterized protein YbjT (DUF2867 family)
MLLAVSGASGKTGWRVVQEALDRGHRVRALVRPGSSLPEGLSGAEVVRLQLGDRAALTEALRGCDALVIATGARPSIDLTGPLQVDAFGVRQQIEACRSVGLSRVVLVSSLCAGLWRHPLNLFGLILVWKRLGERWLEQSGLSYTVVRPGGLKEQEEDLALQRVQFSGPDQQRDGSIPRRLVAQVCLDALGTPASVGRILEITSRPAEAKPAERLAAGTGLTAWLA